MAVNTLKNATTKYSRTDLWFFRVFRTQDPESFAVGLLLRVVEVTEQITKSKSVNRST